MMRYICLVFAILLGGCSMMETSSHQSLPAWWVNAPRDNATWLYGLGEGQNLHQARQQALATIAGKLTTKVSSQLRVRNIETTHNYTQYVDRNTQSIVEDVNLSHYQVASTVSSPKITRVLVKLNRVQLAQSWKTQYQQWVHTLAKQSQHISGQSIFRWWLTARSLLPLAAKIDRQALLYQALTGQTLVHDHRVQLETTIAHIPLTVRVQGQNDTLRQHIIDSLSQMGLTAQSCNVCQLVISFKPQFTDEKIFDQQVATLDFYGQLRDQTGIVSKNHWVVQGASITSKAYAQRAAAIQGVQQMKKMGLWKSFGLVDLEK